MADPGFASPPPNETAIAVIPNVAIKSGFLGLGARQYTVLVTSHRVVFARITMQKMKQLVADARDDAKAAGKGFMGQWGAQLTAYTAFAQGYLQIPPDQVLAENEDNFAIDRADIRSIRLKAGHEIGDSGTDSADLLIIKTSQKKYKITLTYGIGPAKQALASAGML